MQELIRDAFEDVGWPVHLHDESGVFQTLYGSEDLQLNGYVQTHADARMIVFYTLHPHAASVAQRQITLEFLNWANWNTLSGNFELDPLDGSIRFRTVVNFGDDPPTAGALRQMLVGNTTMHMRYGLGLQRLVRDGASLEEACAEVL